MEGELDGVQRIFRALHDERKAHVSPRTTSGQTGASTSSFDSSLEHVRARWDPHSKGAILHRDYRDERAL